MYLLRLNNIFHNNELKSAGMMLFGYCNIIKMISNIGMKNHVSTSALILSNFTEYKAKKKRFKEKQDWLK